MRVIQLYRPGSSLVHRLPAGAKLAIVAVTALVVSAVPLGAVGVGAALAVVLLLYGLARLPAAVLGAEIWRLRWLVLVLAAALWIFASPLAAWISTGRVVALVLLASLLTITTRMGDLLAVLQRILEPLRRFGADPDAVALALSLTITMIPVVAGFAAEVREAQRARGVRLGVRGVVPLLVRTLRHADDVGDALSARGLG
ncbi:energy-coupling factor transporter transmembrane protein EcfT [Microbacterium capsulatum]|uniref:Energy-coupling factor transporter transmembrane protein EcfT n=1 Tax=Microbacterium capsulatum TaxID=3041921 RepID=A0ABU0XGM5_9MICO|nr:energy-coupling factor transporter transmembrane protein EcfT [Microbacterium sp. ASV81]MDQ4213330.1 energy-coupling factor transporter transmembrane protein EcfT [Microbacterium sp. ASV81]